MSEAIEVDALDRKIIRLLQGQFPLVAEPYKALAAKIGIRRGGVSAACGAYDAEKKDPQEWGRFSVTVRSALRPTVFAFGMFPTRAWTKWRGRWRSTSASPIVMTAIVRRIGAIMSIR